MNEAGPPSCHNSTASPELKRNRISAAAELKMNKMNIGFMGGFGKCQI